MSRYPVHPLVLKAVPEISEADYKRLKAGIKEHGLLNPIVVCDGQIIDGRTRERICEELSTEPRYVEYDNKLPISVYILQTNLRRNLTEAQYDAMIVTLASEVVPVMRAEAQRAIAKGAARGGQIKNAKCPPRNYEEGTPMPIRDVQKRLRSIIKPGKADAAIAVIKHPDLTQQVQDGTMSLKQAHLTAKERHRGQVVAQPNWEKENDELLEKIKRPSILPPDTALPSDDDLLRHPVEELRKHQADIHKMGRTLLWNQIRQHTNALIRKKHLDPRLIAWVTDITLRHQLQERRLSLNERNKPPRERKPEKRAKPGSQAAFERRFAEYWTQEEKLLDRFFGYDSLRKAISKWRERANIFADEKLQELNPQSSSQDGENPVSGPNGVGSLDAEKG